MSHDIAFRADCTPIAIMRIVYIELRLDIQHQLLQCLWLPSGFDIFMTPQPKFSYSEIVASV
jgi:hypothetical protein